MDVVFLIARIIFALGALGLGAKVLDGRAEWTRLAKGAGAPAPELLILATGAATVVGALFIGFGLFADLGALLLAAALLFVTPLRWAFWGMRGTQRELAKLHFLKNLAIFGAVVLIFWIYNQLQGDAPLSLTDPLIGPWQ